jgi:IMP cyclohydrolase
MKLSEALQKTDYPGRGIFIGRSPDNGKAVIAYFLTVRCEGSRHRILVSDGDGIRTESFDALQSFRPVPLCLFGCQNLRRCDAFVTNGDQTETVCSFLTQGKTLRTL